MLAQLSRLEFSDQVWWFTVRTTGIVSMFTLAAMLITGMLTSSRLLGRKPSYPWLEDLHKFLSSTTLALLIAHLLGLYLDDFVAFSELQTLAPFLADFEDSFLSEEVIWLTLGSIAFWLAILVDLSSRIKRKLPKKLWHSIHLSAFAIFILGGLHAWNLGSDVDNRFLLVAAGGVATVVVMVLTGRLRQKFAG